MQAAANASFAEKFATEHQVNAIERTGIDNMLIDDMINDEVNNMKETETWRIYNMLSDGPGSIPYTLAMFQLCGIIIDAADKSSDPMVTSNVMCCEVKEPLLFQDSPMFSDLDQGDTVVTIDRPCVIKMGQRDIIKHDTPDGVVVITCWKYHLDAQQGVKLEKAGLCFMQHLNKNNHLCNLLSLAKLLKPQMTELGTQIACMQAAQASSTSVSDFQVASNSAGRHATAVKQLE